MKKTKSVKKKKIEKRIKEAKKSSPSKLIWWIFGIVGFIIFLSMLVGGGNNSNYKSGSSKGTNTGRDYIPLVSKGISENGIWGTRCYYSNGKVLEIESPRSVQIQGGWPPKCPAKY